MKINIYVLLLSFLTIFASQLQGQAVSNRTETNCNNESRSIYGEIATNKVIFVVAAATNCGNCMSEAPDIAVFAEDHTQSITVWGAMNNLFGTTDCPSVNSWEDQYSWTGIFTFVDADDFWVNGGFTYFTVINPHDSSIAYSGLDFEVAKDTAEAMSRSVGVDEPWAAPFKVRDAFPNPFSNKITIKFDASSNETVKVRLFDITGQEIVNRDYHLKPIMKEVTLNLFDYSIQKGVYLLRIENGDQVETIRMIRD